MKTGLKKIILPIALIALSGAAMAHPHKSGEEESKAKPERVWPYFGKKAKEEKKESQAAENKTESLTGEEFAQRLEKRFEAHSEKFERAVEKAEGKNDFLREGREIRNADDIREAARAIEDLVSESGIISSFADMMLGLAEDFDVEASDGGLALNFEGERIGRVKMKRDKHTDSSFDIEGFGRNMTIEKEVIKRDGKTKTRIVIEVDGDEEFDIDLIPKSKN
ncbi:hypothetical protein [Hellea balneolensis]|uniref:hypothetical protein n=1 Tax=Hellea balneolensis TaxID=287478 RepID=UPI000404CA3F|nr:hypothetical protein [Hellea balneolensis]